MRKAAVGRPCTTYFVAELPRIVRCPASWIAAMRAAGWAPFARRLG